MASTPASRMSGVSAITGVLGNAATGILQKRNLDKQAKWMRRRGRLAARLEEWHQAKVAGAIRVATQDRAAGDTLHLQLANAINAGIAVWEARMPYEMARADLRYDATQSLMQGIGGAFSSMAGASGDAIEKGYSFSDMFGINRASPTLLGSKANTGFGIRTPSGTPSRIVTYRTP